MSGNLSYAPRIYKEDLALNNLQRLIIHKKTTNQPTNQPSLSQQWVVSVHLQF